MTAPLATNFLVPSGQFVLFTAVSLLVFALLVVWPFVETLVGRQWGYLIGVIVLGPIGGLLWFAVGRRQSSPSLGTSRRIEDPLPSPSVGADSSV